MTVVLNVSLSVKKRTICFKFACMVIFAHYVNVMTSNSMSNYSQSDLSLSFSF